MRTGWMAFLGAASVLWCIAGTASAQEVRKVDEEASKYKAMPWHLVDLWWDLGEDRPFQSYSLDVTIEEDVSPDVRLYVAPLGIASFGETKCYGGLQTQADGYTRLEPRLRSIGRGTLFSMWGERSLDAIRPSDGGLLQSSGHEGDFVSVRRPYEWRKGSYTYRIVRMEQQEVDGKPCTWVGAFLNAHDRNENIFIGALRFPVAELVMGKKTANFIEIYGRRKPVAEIPKTTVTFSNLKFNGKPVEPTSLDAVYPKGVPDYADAVVKDGVVVVNVGEPVEKRSERKVRLIGADGAK